MTKTQQSKRINARRAARIAAGISEQKAARMAGLRLSTFRLYERSGFPYHRAEMLAPYYKCPITTFR